jgi:hypothetical protein
MGYMGGWRWDEMGKDMGWCGIFLLILTMRCWCIEAYWGIGIHTWITYGFGDMHGVYECGWMETCPTAMDVIGWKWSKRWHVLRGKNLDATHVFLILLYNCYRGFCWFGLVYWSSHADWKDQVTYPFQIQRWLQPTPLGSFLHPAPNHQFITNSVNKISIRYVQICLISPHVTYY